MRRLTATAAQRHLSELLDDIERNSDTVIHLTRRRKPVAVLLSYERLDALLESLEILGDAAAMSGIAKSRRASRAGKKIPIEKVLRELVVE